MFVMCVLSWYMQDSSQAYYKLTVKELVEFWGILEEPSTIESSKKAKLSALFMVSQIATMP